MAGHAVLADSSSSSSDICCGCSSSSSRSRRNGAMTTISSERRRSNSSGRSSIARSIRCRMSSSNHSSGRCRLSSSNSSIGRCRNRGRGRGRAQHSLYDASVGSISAAVIVSLVLSSAVMSFATAASATCPKRFGRCRAQDCDAPTPGYLGVFVPQATTSHGGGAGGTRGQENSGGGIPGATRDTFWSSSGGSSSSSGGSSSSSGGSSSSSSGGSGGGGNSLQDTLNGSDGDEGSAKFAGTSAALSDATATTADPTTGLPSLSSSTFLPSAGLGGGAVGGGLPGPAVVETAGQCCHSCRTMPKCAHWRHQPTDPADLYGRGLCVLLMQDDKPQCVADDVPAGTFPEEVVGSCQPGVVDDPHFVDGYGVAFDFHGEVRPKGVVYCLISDFFLHINVLLDGYKDNRTQPGGVRTWIKEVGVIWRGPTEKTHTLVLKARRGPRDDRGPADTFLQSIILNGRHQKNLDKPGDILEFPGDSELDGFELQFDEVVPYGPFEMERYHLLVPGLAFVSISMRPGQKVLRTPTDSEVHFNLQFPRLGITQEVHGVLGQTFRLGREERERAFDTQKRKPGEERLATFDVPSENQPLSQDAEAAAAGSAEAGAAAAAAAAAAGAGVGAAASVPAVAVKVAADAQTVRQGLLEGSIVDYVSTGIAKPDCPLNSFIYRTAPSDV